MVETLTTGCVGGGTEETPTSDSPSHHTGLWILILCHQVKAQAGVLSILVKRVDDVPRSLLVTAASGDEAKKARMLLGMHLKNVEFLERTEKRMQRVQSDITAVQVSVRGKKAAVRCTLVRHHSSRSGSERSKVLTCLGPLHLCTLYGKGAVAAGLRIEFNIAPELTGLVIGKKGSYINKVYEATGVSKIDVHDGLVRVVGPSMTAVNRAREMLEFHQVSNEAVSGCMDGEAGSLSSSLTLLS